MATDSFSQSALDTILALQITVAWAGEALSEPKRVGWWRTDLVDELGGGDLFKRLFPHTHQWASLEAVRQVAIQVDKQAREGMAKPDEVRTLLFWGFAVDEKLAERLSFHKRSGKKPVEVLDFPLELNADFVKVDFEDALRMPNHNVTHKLVPGGREIAEAMPEALELRAKKLAAGLLPLADNYPMPFYRVEGR